jgi:hypothetical protein
VTERELRELREAGQAALMLDPSLLPPLGATVRFEGFDGQDPATGVVEVLRSKGESGHVHVQLSRVVGFVSRWGEPVTLLALPDLCPPIGEWPRRGPRLNVSIVLLA